MAFENKRLTVIGYANGFTMWHYSASEPMDEIEGKNYFGAIWTLAALGDLFIITDNHGKTYQRQIVELGKERIILGKLSD